VFSCALTNENDIGDGDLHRAAEIIHIRLPEDTIIRKVNLMGQIAERLRLLPLLQLQLYISVARCVPCNNIKRSHCHVLTLLTSATYMWLLRLIPIWSGRIFDGG
jgi:hypothetical protein